MCTTGFIHRLCSDCASRVADCLARRWFGAVLNVQAEIARVRHLPSEAPKGGTHHTVEGASQVMRLILFRYLLAA